MKQGYIEKTSKILTIFTIGLLSVGFCLLRSPINQVFVPQGEVNANGYGISLQEASGESFLLGSPLNDFYYRGFSKNHVLDGVVKNKNENLLEDFLTEAKELFLNKKGLGMIFEGENHEGSGIANYRVKYSDNKIEIERDIALDKNFDAVGLAVGICSGCFIADDQNRVYLNREFLSPDAINFATKMKLTLLIIGENQFFPSGASKIIILNKNGEVKMQIPTYPNEQISLQGNWNLLEFKIPIKSSKQAKFKQTIYL
jgi:hypothetical protein